ncbi:MAG: FMN-binding protein [bacterium]|nr:FMN-binding protein [bacterium]
MEQVSSPKESRNEQTNGLKMLRAMVSIGALCGLLIVLTFEGSEPRINTLRAEALKKAVFKVLPPTASIQGFGFNGDIFVKTDNESEVVLYAGYNDSNELSGLAIIAQSQGYADIIKILYGYDIENQKVVGFHVLESKETPGLGDKIEKDPEFLENFKSLDATINLTDKALINQVVTVKSGTKQNSWEIDGITGATISSRAIGDAINKSLQNMGAIIQVHKENFELNE